MKTLKHLGALLCVLILAGATVGDTPTPEPAPASVRVKGPAGTYTVIADGPVEIIQSDGFVAFQGSVQPVPVPTPAPSPDPAPPAPDVPTSNNPLWVIAVTDSTHPLTAAQQALIKSTTVGPAIAQRSATWRAYDAGDPKLSAWKAVLPPPPGLLVIEQAPGGTSKLLAAPLPLDEDAVVSLVKSIRGRF